MSRCPRFPALALALLVLVAALPAAGIAQGGQPPEDSGRGASEGNESTGDDRNQTSEEGNTSKSSERDANRSDEGNTSETNRSEERNRSSSDAGTASQEETGRRGDASGGPNGSADGGPPADGRGSERGRADPVAIEARPDGFATRAPPASPRPTIEVDAGQARAVVERSDVASLEIQLDALVEYEDEDGDGAYDLGEPVVQRMPLRQIPHRIVEDPANETRAIVYELEGGTRLLLTFHLGTGHAPEVASKFDVTLLNHTFRGPDTRIALGSRVEVPGGLENVELGDEPALAGSEGDAVPYLSWVSTVHVDGVEQPVGASVHLSTSGGDENAIVYWSYPQGEEIVHDPKLGVTAAIRDLAGQLAPFALGIAATLGILLVGYATRRRGRW